jgi:hypothetical protein
LLLLVVEGLVSREAGVALQVVVLVAIATHIIPKLQAVVVHLKVLQLAQWAVFIQ